MAIAAGTRQRDVDKSFHALIKSRFEDAVVANNGKVIYDDRLQDRTAFDDWWVEIHKIQNGARRGRATLYQVSIVYECGDAADQSTQDRYGDKATEKADEFLELVIPENDLGFKTFDYTDPTTPVATERHARVITDDGQMGEADTSIPIFDDQKGLVHVVMVIPVKLDEDLISLPVAR